MTKHLFDRPPVLIPVLVTVLLAGVIGGGLLAAPAVQAGPSMQGSTTVAISPAQVELACGQTAQVDIRVNNVEDLFGVDLKVTYDPRVVEVVDANASMPGIQVQPGDLPDVAGGAGLIQVNSVDGTAGTISYAAIRLHPATPQSGNGIIASVTFRGRAAGTSPVSFDAVVLSNETARPISAEQVDGQIKGTCTNPPPTTAATATTVPGATVVPPTPRPPTTPGAPPPQPVPVTSCTHIVRPGDTLYSIARMYGATVTAVMTANGITNPNVIYAGQTLKIPGCTKPTPGEPPSPACVAYTVKPGDTLTGIAMAHGDCVWPLAQRNHIVNPNLVYAGQVLTVCPGCGGTTPPPPCRAMYTVTPGATLDRVALLYGTTVAAIQAANGIANPNWIYAGQVLCIP